MDRGGRKVAVLLLIFLVNVSAEVLDTVDNGGDAWGKAATWLLSQRNGEMHWGKQWNPWAILALSRSSPANWNASSAEFQVAVKQMDIDFLGERLRYGDVERVTDRMLAFTTALISLCRSPSNYYDYDLSEGISQQAITLENYGFISSMLVVCSGDGTVNKSNARRVFHLLNPNIHNSTAIGLMAKAIMSAQCLIDNFDYGFLRPFNEKMVISLIKKQRPDGSFEFNLGKTALAIQALEVAGVVEGANASRQAAKEWLRSRQSGDGSFLSDVMATAEAMMALSGTGGRGRLHLSRCRKEVDVPDIRELEAVETDGKIAVHIFIWFGEPPQKNESIVIKMPVNSTIYDALSFAEGKGHLTFETRKYSIGRYLLSINGIKENSGSLKSWTVYVFPPDINHAKPTKETLLQTGITTYQLSHGERMLFWFRVPPAWAKTNPEPFQS